jgi:hypothetical protein
MSTNTVNTVNIDKAGYVAGVRCGLGHSGNQRLIPADRRNQSFQCCGCGRFYGRDEVTTPTDGENGSGGVIRR